jgi:AcrR family transcriptional regulator
MPKISAPTVVEHRRLQRAALLDAARRLLTAGGGDAMTIAAVAAGAGLARNSVYEYFADRTELLLAVIEAEFPAWDRAARAAMASDDDPAERVIAYARTQLELVAGGEHRIAAAVRNIPLDASSRARIRELHLTLMAPLRAALAGYDDPDRWAVWVQAVIDAATTQIERGGNPSAETASAVHFLRAALR